MRLLILWIQFGYQKAWPLTNLTLGGEGTYGYTMTDAQREKMRIMSRGKPKSLQHRLAISEAQKGIPKTMTPALLEAQRTRRLGKKDSEEVKAKRNASLRGRKRTPEQIERIRTGAISGWENRIGEQRKQTPEHIAKRNAWRLEKGENSE